MSNVFQRWMLMTGVSLLLCSSPVLAMPAPLDDEQLSEVYAAGFDIRVDFDIDLAAKNPDSLLVQSSNLDALQEYANQRLSHTAALGGSPFSSGRFDAGGTFLPNIPQITNNTLTISDNAMQNAKTLLNIIALQGDVAVGMNMNIIVNPGNTPFTVTQTNINWGILNLSDSLPTLTSLTNR